MTKSALTETTLFLVAAVTLAGVTASAEPPPPAELTIGGLTLGKPATGELLAPDSLRHRVVLLVLWNRSGEASREALMLLEQTHRGHAPAGLLVVASHVGRGTLAEVRQTVDKLGISFPVVDDSSIAGLEPSDPPLALVFDHRGGCIARGGPRDMAGRAVAALREAPPYVLAGRHLVKLATLERLLRDESHFGAALRRAGELTGDSDAATADEAAFVVERLTAAAADMLARADAMRAADAATAAALAQRVASAFRGTDIGLGAAGRLREWRRDPAFAGGLQAASLVAQLEAMRTQALAEAAAGRSGTGLRPPPAVPRTASLATAARIPAHVRSRMSQVAAMVRRLGPGSRYADRAEEIAVELGLELPAEP